MYSKRSSNNSRIGNEAIVTSKGRSVLNLAMETQKLDFQRYLIVERNVNIFQYTNLRVALRNLEMCLQMLPQDEQQNLSIERQRNDDRA